MGEKTEFAVNNIAAGEKRHIETAEKNQGRPEKIVGVPPVLNNQYKSLKKGKWLSFYTKLFAPKSNGQQFSGSERPSPSCGR